MAFETFNLAPSGGQLQESNTVTVGSGERARVRFDPPLTAAAARLKIVSNGTTTYATVTDTQAFVADGVLDGDVVSLVVNMGRSDTAQASGVLETG